MTAATEPPLITPAVDVDELPALDQPDERVCELSDCDTRQPCTNAVAWLLAVDAADCGHFRGPVLACTSCKDTVIAEGLVKCPRVDCVLACYITWIEAL